MALPFNGARSWKEKVLKADKIWAQVKAALQNEGTELPKTLRRPDVRLILNNVSGVDKIFRNPGDHSNSKAEAVPASGEKTAAMVMVRGETLAEQYANAEKLLQMFDLGAKGLSEEFVIALSRDRAGGLVDEAYGPAPYNAQADKLVDVTWEGAEGETTNIKPVKASAASFGARAATEEAVFFTDVVLYVQGTGTTAECIEGPHMLVAVSEDWRTKAETTRPIVPSVARTYYGGHYNDIPVVTVNPDGFVQRIDLKNGTVIDVAPSKKQAAAGFKPG